MLTFVSKYAKNIYSQQGEDCIIEECLKRIKPKLKSAVEFGGADGTYCSNTAALRDKGWTVNMYDLQGNDYVIAKAITPDNVNHLPDCSILSIDIDGNDYNVWKAYNGSPDIVVIEINSSIAPDQGRPVSDLSHGTAYKPMVELGIHKGYFLLCHTGNLIFIKDEYRKLFPEVIGDGIGNYELYFNRSWLK